MPKEEIQELSDDQIGFVVGGVDPYTAAEAYKNFEMNTQTTSTGNSI
jgi:hypothetical protein